VNILEIGVGGYDNPNYGGNSLRMWKRYFYRGKIDVIIDDGSHINQDVIAML